MTFGECLDKSLRIAHFFRNAGYVQVDSFPIFNVQELGQIHTGGYRVHSDGEQTGLLLLLDGSWHDRSHSSTHQQQFETGD